MWKSVAAWPANKVSLGNIRDFELDSGVFIEVSISEDTHGTKEEAENIAKMLLLHGFGGDGEIFPVDTWTEEAL